MCRWHRGAGNTHYPAPGRGGNPNQEVTMTEITTDAPPVAATVQFCQPAEIPVPNHPFDLYPAGTCDAGCCEILAGPIGDPEAAVGEVRLCRDKAKNLWRLIVQTWPAEGGDAAEVFDTLAFHSETLPRCFKSTRGHFAAVTLLEPGSK